MDATALLAQVALYTCGLIGYVAITLIPVRAWQTLSPRSLRLRWAARRGKITVPLVLVAACAALAFWFVHTQHVSRCLLGFYCGANRASGWFSLASMGLVYLAFELVLVVCRRAAVPTGSGTHV